MTRIWEKFSYSKVPLLQSDKEVAVDMTVGHPLSSDQPSAGKPQAYRLYKRRFAGLFGLFILNVIAAMSMPWFGPISDIAAAEFDISVSQVNWLANCVSCVYVPATLFTPWIVNRYGVRKCCLFAGATLLISGWVRFAGTVKGLSGQGAYALLLVGQLISAVSQAIYQVLGPKYSETWFDQHSRTTATMIIAISNPVGSALGQVISPLVGTVSKSILILALISSAVVPFALLIGDKPPTPPTASASKKTKSLNALVLDIIGKPREGFTPMTRRQKIDFFILLSGFAANVSATNTFGVMSGQDLVPYGYTASQAGLIGATILIAGVVCALITSPLIDRVFTNRATLVMKVIGPFMAAAWLSLNWALRPNNAPALFVIFGFIGACGVTLLPITLELAVDLTGSADASSAILWSVGNVFSIVFLLAETALQAGADGDPPFNTKKSIIFQTVIIVTLLILFIPFKGEQTRRLQDEKEAAEAKIDAFDIEHRGAAGTPDSDQGSESDTHPAFVDPYERA